MKALIQGITLKIVRGTKSVVLTREQLQANLYVAQDYGFQQEWLIKLSQYLKDTLIVVDDAQVRTKRKLPNNMLRVRNPAYNQEINYHEYAQLYLQLMAHKGPIIYATNTASLDENMRKTLNERSNFYIHRITCGNYTATSGFSRPVKGILLLNDKDHAELCATFTGKYQYHSTLASAYPRWVPVP